MGLTLRTEQRDLRALVRDFVADQPTEDVARRALDGAVGHSPQTWAKLVRLGVLDPVLDGGTGDLAVVAEELGRGLLCAPFLPVAGLVAGVLDPADPLLRRIVDEGRVATVAWLPPGGRWEEPGAFGCRAEDDGSGGRVLSGTTEFVLFGADAEVVLVAAETASGPAVLVVACDAPGLVRDPMPTLDATRPQARLSFIETPAELVVAPDASPALHRALDRAGVLLAAEQLGTAERAMEMAVEYARMREQFGRPIGSFQAVKHLCADMFVGVESLRSAVRAAADAIDVDAPDRAVLASLAQAVGSEVAAAVTDAAVHVHGGVGFTWEHPAGLYLRRALGDAPLFGAADHHLARLADRAGL